MKKYLIFILIILSSCQKDEIIEPAPAQQMIFEMGEVSIQDNQLIHFSTPTQDTYQLRILLNSSVVSKENFNSTVGVNKRKIYTKTLTQGQYTLQLLKGSEIINETEITVE